MISVHGVDTNNSSLNPNFCMLRLLDKNKDITKMSQCISLNFYIPHLFYKLCRVCQTVKIYLFTILQIGTLECFKSKKNMKIHGKYFNGKRLVIGNTVRVSKFIFR